MALNCDILDGGDEGYTVVPEPVATPDTHREFRHAVIGAVLGCAIGAVIVWISLYMNHGAY